ncbi:MAG: hypothetical protein ACN4GT_04430 [Gammaproteobacteria bacterium]
MDANQAVEVNSIMLATMAGAMVVLSGALYAAVFAIGRLAENVNLVRLSYLFYGVLVVSVLVLARTLNFSGVWNGVAIVIMIGYLIAPQGIWYLCVGTHAGEAHDASGDAANEHRN